MSDLKEIESHKSFGGWVRRFSHSSKVCNCTMNFYVFVPAQAETQKVPILYFLSGLTSTDENFIIKAGAQEHAAEHGLLLVAPDTSPRGLNIEGDNASWDFGVGAGFYVDATEPKWSAGYNMYSYVTKELPDLIKSNFNVLPNKESLFGFSMGGHGALITAFKNPGRYSSVTAFAPISNPSNCPWGKKAFAGYLGSDQEHWKEYDATELVKKYQGPNLHIIIDQGTKDKFLAEQLLPENFVNAAKSRQDQVVTVDLRLQADYDHSFFFVASFVGEHIDFHAKHLKA